MKGKGWKQKKTLSVKYIVVSLRENIFDKSY